MVYQRKTRDCWRFYLNYGQGWKHEITAYTGQEKDALRFAFHCDDCSYPLKIVTGRERIEEGATA